MNKVTTRVVVKNSSGYVEHWSYNSEDGIMHSTTKDIFNAMDFTSYEDDFHRVFEPRGYELIRVELTAKQLN